MCITTPGTAACPLHPVTPELEFDRDQAGRTNIGLRGVASVCRLPVVEKPIDLAE